MTWPQGCGSVKIAAPFGLLCSMVPPQERTGGGFFGLKVDSCFMSLPAPAQTHAPDSDPLVPVRCVSAFQRLLAEAGTDRRNGHDRSMPSMGPPARFRLQTARCATDFWPRHESAARWPLAAIGA